MIRLNKKLLKIRVFLIFDIDIIENLCYNKKEQNLKKVKIEKW